ncbi:MAG TPA: thymidine phosphorylase [Thermoanaerobaculia bacterium]|nr:thymidine phosphorylase [Thermoanaerobaculia bacterium]
MLERKRNRLALSTEEIEAVVAGAVDGSWSEGQLAAFLMAAWLNGLGGDETLALTRAMLHSGEVWNLRDEVPFLGDKHSTGGVGDKLSLTLSPLLAACGRPVVMLTGRGLGHTAGTADKLDTIPGLDQALTRDRALTVLRRAGMAIGLPTATIAPADRRLYALRDATATIESLPLIVASILSKKLATGAAAVVFDVKAGSGAFLPEPERARELARLLIETSVRLGTPARALITDMGQPLGRYAGHAAEVLESLEVLAGGGPGDTRELTLALAVEVAEAVGSPIPRAELEAVLDSGRARETFLAWSRAQGAEAGWEKDFERHLAPVKRALSAPRSGFLVAVDAREVGLLLVDAGGGRRKPGDAIDFGITLESHVKVGEAVTAGQPLATLHLRGPQPEIEARLAACFRIGEERVLPPPLVYERVAAPAGR